MSRALVLILCLVGNLATIEGALDLNPTLTEYTAEGITFKQLVFKGDSKKVTYELPSQWGYRKSGDSIKLMPPNNSNADIAIQTTPLSAPQPFDEKGMAAAREHFLRGVPPGSQMLKLLSELQDTIPFRGGANYEITASYRVLGEAFIRRAIYINLPDTQLIFRLSARQSEFEALYRTFRTSILSWQSVDEPSVLTAKAPVTAARVN